MSLYECRDHLIEIGAVELAVRKVEYLVVADVEQLAGCGKLRTAQRGELFVGACRASIPRSRSCGQTNTEVSTPRS